MANFPTEFLFKRLSNFWDAFEDREEIKCVWDAYLRKANAVQAQLLQADLSKSLKTIPLFDRNQLEYFIFPKLVRRTDRELNGPFYVFEVDPTIFFIKNLNEKIDNTLANRVLSPPDAYQVTPGSGEDLGKTFLEFMRGVAPVKLGETFWTRGSSAVTGTNLALRVKVGDIVQGQNGKFYKVIAIPSDTSLTIQGQTVLGENLGPGNGVQTVFNLAATALVIPSSVELFFDGVPVPPANFTVTPGGVVTFAMAPFATVASITANYYLGYDGVTAFNRQTVLESIPDRLLSSGSVYRDRREVFKNFGFGIELDRPTSFLYLNQVRGLYFARYNGPTITNMSLGSGILIDLPFSEAGIVTNISPVIPRSVTVDANLFPIADPLNIEVSVGQKLTRDFNLITDGVRTADFINDPAFFNLEPLKSDPRKFFLFFVIVKGSYAVHVITTTGRPIDYALLEKFKRQLKPSYTDNFILTDIDFIADNLNLFIGPVEVTNGYDAAATLEFNCINWSVIPQFMQTNGFPFMVADELVASGPLVAGDFATDFGQIVSGTFELHRGSIVGPLLASPAEYTINLTTGLIQLTAAGAAAVNATIPPDLHAKYTSGLAGESALVASDECGMDSDSIGLLESEFQIISGEEVLIDTLENNLVNFGTFGGPPPEEMDDDSIPMVEALAINEAIGTPPASFLPPFTPGALIYMTP